MQRFSHLTHNNSTAMRRVGTNAYITYYTVKSWIICFNLMAGKTQLLLFTCLCDTLMFLLRYTISREWVYYQQWFGISWSIYDVKVLTEDMTTGQVELTYLDRTGCLAHFHCIKQTSSPNYHYATSSPAAHCKKEKKRESIPWYRQRVY